jgi:putative exporter of polyketide antibiotics
VQGNPTESREVTMLTILLIIIVILLLTGGFGYRRRGRRM